MNGAHLGRLVKSCVLLLVLLAGRSHAEPMAELLVESAGRPVGFVHLPRCGSPDLLLELARAAPNAQIHAQHPDAAVVAEARRAVSHSGLLNRRIYIDPCELSRLLPVGNSADLIAMTDATGDDLTAELAGEIVRVLHPWYGMAIVGGAASEEDLEAWGRSFEALGCKCRVTKSSGDAKLPRAWLTIRKPAIRGADDWTHWWHRADNNAVSTDTAYAAPESLQWTGKPFFSTRLELPIVTRGRVFVLWNGHLLDVTRGEAVLAGEQVVLGNLGLRWTPDAPMDDLRGPLVTAQAAGSGVRLWAKRLSPAAWLQVARSTMVADGDSLFVADGHVLLELDQATGGEIRRIQADCGEIRWMAVSEARLVLVGGPATRNHGRRAEALVVPFRSSGLSLTVLDRGTLKKLWQVRRKEGGEAFDPRSAAIAAGRLFVCTEAGRAEAYRIADGTIAWRAETGIVRLPPRGFEWDRSSRHPVTGYAVAGLYVIAGPETDRCAVLSQDDGRAVWELPRGRGPVGPIPLAFDDLVWFGSQAVDPANGEVARQLGRLNRGGCSRWTASPQGIFGTCGLVWDRATGETFDKLPAKSSCSAGTLVANGLAWKFPSACTNCTEWRGFVVRSAGDNAPPAPQRVVSVAEVPPPDLETKGWVTYRADANRSAFLDVVLPEDVAVVWRTSGASSTSARSASDKVLLDAEIVPAPPVVAGGMAIVARADGVVEALAVGSGERIWRSFTSGRISSSPTIWKDRVFVASADGCIHAFRLADGSPLWHARVAPQVGRTMIYGQLGCRWPALGCPLVLGGRVFATAGMLDGVDGVFCCAMDAASGSVLWETNRWEAAGADGILSGAGQLCAGRDLIFHGGEAPLARISPQDGRVSAAYVLPGESEARRLEVGPRHVQAVYRCSKGQDAGCLTPEWTVFGGRRLLIDQAESGHWRCELTFLKSTSDGKGHLPVLAASDAVLLPAWDAKDVLLAVSGRRHDGVAIAGRGRLVEHLARTLDGAPASGPAAVRLSVAVGEEGTARWRRELRHGERVAGCALTRNAALVVTRGAGLGRLIAFDRGDGGRQWEVSLPASPLYDGLALGPDGTIVLALRDGSILGLGAANE